MSQKAETLGVRVRAARKLRGLTQEELHRRGGPSKPTQFRIEKDPDYIPEEYTLQRLAQTLQVNLEWLKSGAGPMEATHIKPLASAAQLDNAVVLDPAMGSASFLVIDPKLLALASEVVADTLKTKGLRCSLEAWNELVKDVYEAAEVLAPHENVISFDRYKESLEQAAERGIIKHRLA